MGDMADMALDDVFIMEGLRDEYVEGNVSLQEAYEHGFVDQMGVEQEGIQEAFDRASIGSIDSLNNELSHTIKDFELLNKSPIQKSVRLNKQAIANLEKENPTCNICANEMSPRSGRYGKFYFCPNYCEGQSTVSDNYWQTIKAKQKLMTEKAKLTKRLAQIEQELGGP